MGGARRNSGPKPLPKNVKLLKNTYRPDKEKSAPDTSENLPIAPSWINTRAKEIFQNMVGRLDEIGLASETYTEALALLSSRMEELERLDRILNEQGYTYTAINSAGAEITKERPESKIREKAAKHVHALLCEFGLSPSAIQRTGCAPKSTKPHVLSKIEQFMLSKNGGTGSLEAFRNRKKGQTNPFADI